MPGPSGSGRVGIVTHLFDRATWDGSNTVAFVCGPERMMQATVETSWAIAGSAQDRIWVTLERHMECGVGLCGHCQIGPLLRMQGRPVFIVADLEGIFGREGI